MSVSPPPSGPWGAPPGPPPFGRPGPGGLPPPGFEQPWYPPPGPPKGNATKWLILAALVAVIVVAAAVIVVVLHSGSSGNSKGSASSAAASGIASANDTGPVTVITEDPSCAAWVPINNTLAAIEQQNGWDKRDSSIPASAWTSEQRTQYNAVGDALRRAADQTVALAKMTPHRVMRELYEQAIAYWRAFVDRLANYTANDENLVVTATTVFSVVNNVCDAITYGSAGARGLQVPAPPAPTQVAPIGDPANPERFLKSENPACTEFTDVTADEQSGLPGWSEMDPKIPADQWSPEYKSLYAGAAPVISTYADKLQKLGRGSDNSVLEDFNVFSAQYLRAYVGSFATYVPNDSLLNHVSVYTNGVIHWACKSVGR